MKKLFAVIFAWTLFSTQAFAQTAVENEKIAQLQKMIDSHLADLEEADIEAVQSFFAGNNNQLASISPEELEEAISQLENMNLEEARELAISLGIEEELSQITEEEWQQHKGEVIVMLNQAGSDKDSYTSWAKQMNDYCFSGRINRALCATIYSIVAAVFIYVLWYTVLSVIFFIKIGGPLKYTAVSIAALVAELGVIVTLIYQAFKKRKCRPGECSSPKDDSGKEPTAWLSKNLHPVPLH